MRGTRYMKIFQIIDEENALLAGILLYYEKAGTCVIELPEYLDEPHLCYLQVMSKRRFIQFHAILVFYG